MVSLWGCRVSVTGHDDYLSREQTGAVKGIFAIIILFSHMRGYLTLDPVPPMLHVATDCLGQLMVVMFLLYSGYGVMEALKRDRQRYTDTFLRHRLLRTWLMFAAAVVLFVILNLVLEREYSLTDNLLAFTGWTSVGNSNWFMFVIMALYVLTYVSLRVAKDLPWVVWINYVLALALLLVLVAAGKGFYWYDTIMAYPTGMLMSLYKESVEKALRGRNWLWATAVVVALFVVTYNLSGNGAYSHDWRMALHIVETSLFALLIVLLTMKLKIGNRVLNWLGINAFAIYILQRLAMITCAHFGLNGEPMIFAAVVIPATLLIAAVYTATFKKILRN